jgi:putative hydrolase of the HAD superfamily
MSDFPIGDKLKFMRLDGLWDVELCTEELGALKPALKPFQALIRALQCPPESILYVGNSVRYDISGAKNAGMRTALIRRLPSFSGTGGADFVFRDYRQLKQFVLQETAPDVKRSSSHGGEKGEGRKEKKYCLR